VRTLDSKTAACAVLSLGLLSGCGGGGDDGGTGGGPTTPPTTMPPLGTNSVDVMVFYDETGNGVRNPSK
jgi:hypothetical protein